MTQLLPTSSSNLGAALKPRKFQQSLSGSVEAGYDSSWFKTPGSNSNAVNDRDEVISTDKAPTSLLELHRKKMEKKSKKKEKKEKKKRKHNKKHRQKLRHNISPESSSSSTSSLTPQLTRRPFDRDKDLKISCIDSAARHALIERSKQLSSRFGYGSRQFL
ncbi:hypothetical protein FBUS_07191 [Fasciolopsis buskii]|uniref:DUF3752 domain-containing protein n=1 Tax=Fasciolopsis buskii TaxID=27845 RepID=A0A8E0RQB9_9TREM|nr:hypothetical protein FBUS_07191 [Fasciolopsis buski]